MSTRTLLTRTSQTLLSKTRVPSVGRRNLTTQGIAAVKKLRGVLEAYRMENCTQELPSRVKKQLLNEAQIEGRVDPNGMIRVIQNIHKNDQISTKDVELIFQEHGGKDSSIAVEEMMKLL
ncbi:MAG: hypothetical protein SGBAC_011861 [Bacillariaceae sp.]